MRIQNLGKPRAWREQTVDQELPAAKTAVQLSKECYPASSTLSRIP